MWAVLRRVGVGVAAVVTFGIFAAATAAAVGDSASRWGATSAEAAGAMPGDGLVGGRPAQSTRAITIDAPPEDVWPWLVQFGAGRGGLHSYDVAERLIGADIRNADRILPEHQHIAVGDTIWVTPEGYPANLVLTVASIEPQRTLVLAATDQPNSRMIPRDPGWSWTFQLVRVDDRTTRLISRNRNVGFPNPVVNGLSAALINPVSFVMERETLVGIQARAEGKVSSDVLLFSLLGAASLLTVSFAAMPWISRPLRLAVLVCGAAAVSLALLLGYPSPWWPLLVIAAVTVLLVVVRPAREGQHGQILPTRTAGNAAGTGSALEA